MKKYRGFTLIEILIAITIVSLLIAIAVPSYTDYVNRARRSDALALLLQVMQQQERYFTEQLEYTTDLSLLGYTVDSSGNIASENSHYLLSAGNCAGMTTVATCVNLTATPQGIQATTSNITLDSRGNRTPAGYWQ
ncbi:type IV pilin protein [Endozoicomonas lisbonensis]|uniref:Type IV pilus assembly protein PilE n=1 Tax=Endozoicomonas lisbonensis TaxID=3120522 RepID=A0ABV2SCS3_9GAMM